MVTQPSTFQGLIRIRFSWKGILQMFHHWERYYSDIKLIYITYECVMQRWRMTRSSLSTWLQIEYMYLCLHSVSRSPLYVIYMKQHYLNILKMYKTQRPHALVFIQLFIFFLIYKNLTCLRHTDYKVRTVINNNTPNKANWEPLNICMAVARTLEIFQREGVYG